MFNAPRPGQNRYTSTTAFGGSYVEESSNPLSSSYDNYDPWSGTTTPPPPEPRSVFSGIIGEASLPQIYEHAFSTVDPNASGDISVNSLVKVLETTGLAAAMIERIVNLVSSKARVSKMEFFVALALVALAQQNNDPSIEQVAALAQRNTLPEPTLNLAAVSNASTIRPSPAAVPATSSDSVVPGPSAPAYSSEDPWIAGNPSVNTPVNGLEPSANNGIPSSIEGTGLPREWWKRQETVSVVTMGQQGFILNRYMTYQVQSERAGPVTRRYSEFAFLWDCLVRRYPFRILINLPPKRVGADEAFIEQRRKGLSRFLTYIVNHPVIREDGLLAVFLTEPSLEAWRKQHPVMLEEESVSKRLDKVEEMSIPSDLEEKLAITRRKIQPVLEQWHRICFVAERLAKRREGSAADFSRLSITLKALNEVNMDCWKGNACELCSGVRDGLSGVAAHLHTASDVSEQRSRALMATSLEVLKSQRDLYLATRDLFIRHDRLSGDQVERLRKRVDTNSTKLEAVRSAQKEGWQTEADRFAGLVERDQAAIAAALARRIFIRYCMWHELRVVLHNRENALLSQAIQVFAKEEAAFVETTNGIWAAMVDTVETMPFE